MRRPAPFHRHALLACCALAALLIGQPAHAAVFINEFQRALLSDMKQYIADLVAHDVEWLHNNPQHSDCDRMNADAHLRALLLGHSLTLQVTGGELVLGQWQRVLLAELDGPRARTLRVQVMGLA